MSLQKISLFALLAASASAGPLTKRQSATPPVGSPAEGAQGATSDVTPGAGPNGAESWLNSGIDDNSGWSPPYLDFSKLAHVSSEDFYQGAGSACRQYDQQFQNSGSKYNIDPAILAAIAMQESSCNANAGSATPGLMQVDCSNYSDGQCHADDVDANVDAGARYLRTQLDNSGNNAIQAFGSYNGWFTADAGMNGGKGLTKDYPCSGEGQGNGSPQNLDYLQQTLNGWILGLNPYGSESWIGTYKCQGSCGGGSIC